MRIYKTAFVALTLALAAAAAIPAHANLLIDGGFEQPAIADGSFATLTAIPGWIGAPTIEVQNHVAGTPYEGNQYVELDTDGNSSMYQDFATAIGATYRIEFQYSPRPGVSAASNGLAFLWDNSPYAMMALSGIDLADTVWSGYDMTAVATSSLSRVSFTAFGISDSRGGYIDNVRVTAVPEPGVLPLFGLGLVILATRLRTRRRTPLSAV